jgi:hypothetical protein
MLDTVLADHRIDISYLNALFTAGMEFRSVHTVVELTADGPEWDADSAAPGIQGAIEIGIEIRLGVEPEASKRFNFRAEITPDTSISLGPKLAGAFLSVPCSVQLKAQQEIELTAPVIVCARNVALNSSSLVLRSAGKDYASSEVTVEAQRLQSCLENIIPNDVSLTFLLADTSGVTYPAIQYVKRSAKPPADPLLRQKYMRLKRILVEFRSHSKGSLAKYKEKIEHERVLKNHIGRAVLNRLVRDQVLSLKGSMYHLNPDGVNRNLGVTWPELRKGQMPESVLNYLRAIDCREPP